MANSGPAAASRAAEPVGADAGVQTAERPAPAEIPDHWVKHEESGRMLDPDDPATWGKIPRNAKCPCGSGKKYKQCHGKA